MSDFDDEDDFDDVRRSTCDGPAGSAIPGWVVENPYWPAGIDPHLDLCPGCPRCGRRDEDGNAVDEED